MHFPSQPEHAGSSLASQQNYPTLENNHEADIDTLFAQEPDYDALHASVDGLGQDLPRVDTTQLQGMGPE